MRDDFKRVTVVFHVIDHKAFEPLWNRMHELFSLEAAEPFRVTAMSVDDEIGRSTLYYEAVHRYDDEYDLREAMEAIFQCQDVSAWCWEKYEAAE